MAVIRRHKPEEEKGAGVSSIENELPVNRGLELHQSVEDEADESTYWRRLTADTRGAQEGRKGQLYLGSKLIPEPFLESREKVRVEEATVLVIDVVGAVGIAESRQQQEDRRRAGAGAQQTNELFRDVFGRVNNEVADLGGDAVAFAGDKVVYLFRGAGHIGRATESAARVRDKVREDIRKNVDPDLDLTGGVATGEVVLARLDLDTDHHKRAIPSVMGEPIVEANRIQAASSPGNIGVDDTVREAMKFSGDGIPVGFVSMDDKMAYGESLGDTDSSLRPRVTDRATVADLMYVKKMLPPRLQYEMMDGGLDNQIFNAERVTSSVAFMRIEEFDEIQAQITRELSHGRISPALTKWEDFLRDCNEIAHDHRGVLENVENGPVAALMFSFGRETPENDALRCALQLRAAADEFKLKSAIGVSSGKISRGMTGIVSEPNGTLPPEDTKEQLGIIGDTVNIAARFGLKSAGTGEILMDKFTNHGAQHRAVMEKTPAGSLKLKNHSEEVKAYRLDGMENAENLMEHNPKTEMVGRKEELESVMAAATRVAETKTSEVVVVVGEAGEGKSLFAGTVVKKLYLEAEPRQVTAIMGRADSYSENKPYVMWKEPVRRLLGLGQEEMADKALVDKISAVLAEADPKYVEYAPMIAEKFGFLGKVKNGEGATDFGGFNFKMAEILAVLAEKMAERDGRPLMMVYEDTHWAAASDRELLKYFIRDADKNVMHMLVKRPELKSNHLPGPGADLRMYDVALKQLGIDETAYTQIQLDRLEPSDWPAFMNAHFPSDIWKLMDSDSSKMSSVQRSAVERAERLAEKVYSIAGGNPYKGMRALAWFANFSEIYPNKVNPNTKKPYDFLAQYGGKDGQWRIGGDDFTEEVLSKIRIDSGGEFDLNLETFRAFNTNERRAFKIGSYFGREFNPADLAEVTGMKLQRIDQIMDKAKRLKVVEQSGDLISFIHYDVWHSMNQMTGEEIIGEENDRSVVSDAELSEMVAQFLEKKYGNEKLADLSRLYPASNNHSKAIYYQLAWGKKLFEVKDNDHYELAGEMFGHVIDTFEKKLDWRKAENADKKAAWEDLVAEGKAQEALLQVGEAYRLAIQSAIRRGEFGVARGLVERFKSMWGQWSVEPMEAENKMAIELPMISSEVVVRRRMKESAKSREEFLDDQEKIIRRAEGLARNKSGEHQPVIDALATYYEQKGIIAAELDGNGRLDKNFEKAIEWAKRSKDKASYDRILSNKVWSLIHVGRHAEGLELTSEIMERAQREHNRPTILTSQMRFASLYMKLGEESDLARVEEVLLDTLEKTRDWNPMNQVDVLDQLMAFELKRRDYLKAFSYTEDMMHEMVETAPESRDLLEDYMERAAISAYCLAKVGSDRSREVGEVIELLDGIFEEDYGKNLSNKEYVSGLVELARAINMMNSVDLTVSKELIRESFEKAESLISDQRREFKIRTLFDKAVFDLSTGDSASAEGLFNRALELAENANDNVEYRKLTEDISVFGQ